MKSYVRLPSNSRGQRRPVNTFSRQLVTVGSPSSPLSHSQLSQSLPWWQGPLMTTLSCCWTTSTWGCFQTSSQHGGLTYAAYSTAVHRPALGRTEPYKLSFMLGTKSLDYRCVGGGTGAVSTLKSCVTWLVAKQLGWLPSKNNCCNLLWALLPKSRPTLYFGAHKVICHPLLQSGAQLNDQYLTDKVLLVRRRTPVIYHKA